MSRTAAMPTIYTFFDNTSATPSPTTPEASPSLDRSRWSDSTMATLKHSLSARRSLPNLRISVASTGSFSSESTDFTDDDFEDDEYPPSVPPKSPSLAYYRGSRATMLGEAMMTSQPTLSSARASHITTTSGHSPSYPSGISYYASDIPTSLSPSHQYDAAPWTADTDAASLNSAFLSPGLTETSPALSSNRSFPRTPSPNLLYSQHKRGGVVMPSPIVTNTPISPFGDDHLHPERPKTRHRATSAPSPMEDHVHRMPDDYFSFYQEQQMRKGRQHVQSLPKSQCSNGSGGGGGKKLWDGLKGLFRRNSDEMGSPEQVEVRHWAD